MPERLQPNRLPNIESPVPVEPPQIDTPVIDMQDLEHVARADTRVSNKGVKIEPRIDDADERDLAREDEAAIEAIEALEKSLERRPPN